MRKLLSRKALITGAGRGIGRAAAILFAENGADLILVARTGKELAETAAQCKSDKIRICQAAVDISDIGQIDHMFDSVKSNFSRLDVLVNNAGHFHGGLMANISVDDFKYTLATNLIAPFYLSQKAITLMDKEIGGTIVNISSFSGCFGVEKFPGFGAYNISKYGLWGLTEILALENRDKNIRVNQISPSGVDTRMFRQAVPPGITPQLTPEEVARFILFLASDDSYPLTGQNIMLSGRSGKE
jgi:NAD(P)-dependent dehydrogenase (short-subunit alcohol dehydrogenase family)